MKHVHILFGFLFLFSAFPLLSQTDSLEKQGTIKIAKKKDAPVYVKASADFKIKGPDRFQPFPIVQGYSFPFNYTRYFSERFKYEKVNLNGKNTHTVNIEVSVSKKGKIYLRDVTYGDNVKFVELPPLNMMCYSFVKDIREWFPAYDIEPQVGKYKGERVIRPVKKNRDATGIITIVFSYEPFD
jgi:hypothetical protein